jgi:hypothetical protein
MSEPVELAKAARANLAAALSALQSSANVPEELMDIAEPIAQAMSVLHRVERSDGANLEGREAALGNIRSALELLQKVGGRHPAAEPVMESVATSLSKVHALCRYAAPQAGSPQARPPAPTVPQPVRASPAPRPTHTANATLLMTPEPAPQAAPPQPAPQPQVAPPPAPQQYAAPQPAQEARPPRQPATTQPAIPQAMGRQPQPAPQQPAQQPAAAQPAARATQASAPQASPSQPGGRGSGAPGAARGAPQIDVELGTHSPSNFYKGLGGNDVIEHGGVFVATYKILKIGTQVSLRILLPGDYEFQAGAVVQWTREGGADSAEPGFGARFTQITPEGRQLVYRYTRNREPIFYDDL